MLRMVVASIRAGKVTAHQAWGACRDAASCWPQLATSGGSPTPKNESVLSSASSPAMLSGRAVCKGRSACGKA